MTDHELVESYIPLAKFIASICSPTCEVVVHDLDDIDHSIVYISNGELTGRKVGDGLINFSISDYENSQQDYISNLPSKVTTANGDIVRCSSYNILNKKGRIIGFLGVNQNLTELYALRSKLDILLNLFPDREVEETNASLAISAKKMVDTYIEDALKSIGCSDVAQLTKDDRRKIIDILAQKNIFIIKGCVNIVARRLRISAPTIYRYIGEVRGED